MAPEGWDRQKDKPELLGDEATRAGNRSEWTEP